MRAEDEMKAIFNHDMKSYKSKDPAITIESVCLTIVAIFCLFVILGKMEEDKTSFVSEQFIKHQELRK